MIRLFTRPLSRLFRRPDLILMRLVTAWIFAGALIVLVAGCDSRANNDSANHAMPPPEVARSVVRAADVELPLEYVAQVGGSREVQVRARVEGILQKRTYTEGKPVKAGETLFLIDPAPFQAALDRARADLAEQEARLAQADKELKRVQPLFADRAVSQKDRDTAQAERDQASAAVKSARAAVRTAEIDLGYTRVTAPIAGITSREVRSEGSLVRPGDASGALTTLNQVDPAYVRFTYAENEALMIRKAIAEGRLRMPAGGPQVEVVLADGSVHPQTGRIDFTDTLVDPQTGTVGVRATVANPDATLLPGQFVRVRLKGVTRPGAIVVPQRAVMQGPDGQFVWVIGDGDKVEFRPVVTGASIGKGWIVEEGLKGGERVATDNLLKLAPGALVVEPKPAPAAAAGGHAPQG